MEGRCVCCVVMFAYGLALLCCPVAALQVSNGSAGDFARVASFSDAISDAEVILRRDCGENCVAVLLLAFAHVGSGVDAVRSARRCCGKWPKFCTAQKIT